MRAPAAPRRKLSILQRKYPGVPGRGQAGRKLRSAEVPPKKSIYLGKLLLQPRVSRGQAAMRGAGVVRFRLLAGRQSNTAARKNA